MPTDPKPLTDAELDFLRATAKGVQSVTASIQDDWKGLTGEDLRVLTVAVDERGRVMLHHPVGLVTVDQIQHVISALLRVAVQSLNREAKMDGPVPPPEIAPVIAGAIRSGWGFDCQFVGVHVENVEAREAMTSMSATESTPTPVVADCCARGAAAFAIQAQATESGRMASGIDEYDRNQTHESAVRRGRDALSAHLDSRSRRRQEAALTAGIPFIRRVGDA